MSKPPIKLHLLAIGWALLFWSLLTASVSVAQTLTGH